MKRRERGTDDLKGGKMFLKKIFCGNEMERMPDIAFRAMSLMFRIMDIFASLDKRLSSFGIREGFTVVDYGCGPGRYLERASRLVGEGGKVYAADIHELAIESVKRRIEKHHLANVEPVLVKGYSCPVPDHLADMIYALDMFHMIRDPGPFLRELHRMVKKEGFLIIEDGHQPRRDTIRKIRDSQIWKIEQESKKHLRCTPR